MNELPRHLEAVALRRSLWDAAFYAAMVGFGETSFVAYAHHLGAGASAQAMIVGLPHAIGALGALFGLALLRRVRSRRALVGACTLVQTLLLLGVPFVEAAGEQASTVLLGMACLHQFFGQSAGTAWSSWYGDTVPATVRGAYFARRQSILQIANFSATLLASAIHAVVNRVVALDGSLAWLGFAIVFVLAALSRAASTAVLLTSPEPRFRGLPKFGRMRLFLATRRGKKSALVLWIIPVFSLLVYLSSPFFAPYIQRELHFTADLYTLSVATFTALKALSLSAWGRAIDARGAGRPFGWAALCVSFIPAPYLFFDSVAMVFLMQAFGGVAWAGFEVGLFAMQLQITTKKFRPVFFAAFGLLNGIGLLLGTYLGQVLLEALGSGMSAFRFLFTLSLVGRLVLGAFVRRL